MGKYTSRPKNPCQGCGKPTLAPRLCGTCNDREEQQERERENMLAKGPGRCLARVSGRYGPCVKYENRPDRS